MTNHISMIKSVSDTTLWKHLESEFDSELSVQLAQVCKSLCRSAENRAKQLPTLMPEYTLHDAVHFSRVTELMASIIPSRVLKRLNEIEVCLLILSAYYHDQGMVLDRNEIERMHNDSNFNVFKEKWRLDHPNLAAAQTRLREHRLTEEELAECQRIIAELESAMLTEYIRRTHGNRSRSYIEQTMSNNSELNVGGTNIASHLSIICESHVKPVDQLTPLNGFYYDADIGEHQVNLVYLALVLRVADILDFDRERTPDSIFRSITFNSEVSYLEWQKHRSIEGWHIAPDKIRYSARCDHPAYERAVRSFLDWIDIELQNAVEIVKGFPAQIADKYEFDLPLKVDRSRIGPRDASYIYADLEFELSRDDIVKLLMTEELYGSPSLAVRELIQNSLDALRHRFALIKRDLDVEWNDGNVFLRHGVGDDGYEYLEVVDNGVGMDLYDITSYLTRVGRSYYRSPEFEQHRIGLRASGVDFDPCSQFGIGFMSCFMLSDNITILTRKFYGAQKGEGAPLKIEIDGLAGIVVIRDGHNDQNTGTTVHLRTRKAPIMIEHYNDEIQLLSMVESFIFEPDFTVHAICEIEELSDEITITPGMRSVSTLLEYSDSDLIETFVQDLSQINSDITGELKISVLVSSSGKIVRDNSDIKIERRQEPFRSNEFEIKSANSVIMRKSKEGIPRVVTDEKLVAVDGIYVSGEYNFRRWRPSGVSFAGNPIDVREGAFWINAKGQMKPHLTPARMPPRRVRGGGGFGRDDASWTRLQVVLSKARGQIWSRIMSRTSATEGEDELWKNLLAYTGDLNVLKDVPLRDCWEMLTLPFLHNKEVEWISLNEIKKISLLPGTEGGTRMYHLERMLSFPKDVVKWAEREDSIAFWVRCLVFSLSVFEFQNGELSLVPQLPASVSTVREHLIGQFPSRILSRFGRGLEDTLTLNAFEGVCNQNHKLVKEFIDLNNRQSDSIQKRFFGGVIFLGTDSDFWNAIKNHDSTQLSFDRLRRIGTIGIHIAELGFLPGCEPPYTFADVSGNRVMLDLGILKKWKDGAIEESLDELRRGLW